MKGNKGHRRLAWAVPRLLPLRVVTLAGFLGALALATVKPAWAQNYTLLYSFQCGPSDGTNPLGTVLDGAGNLYGITAGGGSENQGTVFELSAAGVETLLHSFAGPPTDGGGPSGGLVRDAGGNLYGATVGGGKSGVGAVFKLAPSGFAALLHSFGPTRADGQFPEGGVVRDRAGNVYGTTVDGGVYNWGVLFEVTLTRTENILHNFNPYGSGDGLRPDGGLVLDTAGDLFGVTFQGGRHSLGAVFEYSASGTESVLHSFAGGSADGATPSGSLVRDPAGNLYGVTEAGGAGKCEITLNPGCGVVFKLNAAGKEGVLYSFPGPPDGAVPVAGLARDAAGNLYGTTYYGGTGGCNDGQGTGCGVIFKVTPTGQETVLYSFTGTPDGSYPQAGLVRDTAGNFYGTTYDGGAYGCGTVFKFTP